MEFRIRLKTIRLERGYTQKQVAAALKTFDVNVSEWERGIKKPNIDSLREICNLLNVSADYLLGRTNEP